MDGTLGATTIKPDQLQILNPLLILTLVPLFESVIYPCFKKCGLLTPLQRIGVGGLLAGLAFVISGIVELNLEVRRLAYVINVRKHEQTFNLSSANIPAHS